MLIRVGAARPLGDDGRHDEGMKPAVTSPLAPGVPPPFIIPHCAKCMLPVEKFTIDWVASPFYLPIQVVCHGRTAGFRISADEVLRKRRTGQPIWVFNERGRE